MKSQFWLVLTLLLGLGLGAQAAATKTETPPKEPIIETPSIVVPVIDLKGLLPAKTETEEPEVPPEPSFGTHLLDWLTENGAAFAKSWHSELNGLVNLPQLDKWWSQQMTVPRLTERWTALVESSPPIIGWALLAALTFYGVLLPFRRSLRPAALPTFAARSRLALFRLGLGLVPIMALLGVGLTLLAANPEMPLRPRLVLQGLLFALALSRLIVVLGHVVLAAKTPTQRLLPIPDARALALQRWLSVLGTLAVMGTWVTDAARLLDAPEEPRRLLVRVLGLVLLMGIISLVRQNRLPVAHWLRGSAETAPGDLLAWARQNLSAHWHRLTIAYLLVGYVVTVLSPRGTGFGALLQGTLSTVLVFLAMNLLLYGLNRLAQRAALAEARQERLPLHQPILRALLRLLVTFGGVYLILLGWNVDFSAWMKTDLMQRLTGAGISVSLAIVSAILCYEILCSILNGAQSRARAGASPLSGIDRAARLQTLLPLIRHSAAVVLSVTVLLIGLSELGVNIAPLLAGAGIVGVAVGFGSQALVKDLITGLFIILEDTIHVGDVVTCGTHIGQVESMTIRTLRLRDLNGALHVLPYSEVTGFINQTRGFAYAVMELGVAYASDLRRVFAVLAEVGAALQQDAEMGQNILAAAEVQGVLNFADSAIIVRVRIKTLPGQQWAVRFAYMLAVKERFDIEGIVIPFPTVTHQFGGAVPPAAPALVELPPRRPVLD
ncbi:MAG: mechanosensitive ion channel [Alphaproteobacteria bacterium]|nr:mechanosensitive ion channel [Alphaproteobacteria bacterium]